MFIPKTILVTGGAGFIGSNFIRYILSDDNDINIVNLDAMTYAANAGNLLNIPSPGRYTFVQGNILDAGLLKKLLKEHTVNTIIHFAAESHVDRSIQNSESFIQTNIVGTHMLLEATRKIWLNENGWTFADCRFYHISTDEIFGSHETVERASFSETSPYDPRSPYSASKAASNHLVKSFHHTYGLPTVISNCTNNYGPYQHPEKLTPKIIDCCINFQVIPIYGNGSNIRDWLYVHDHCVAIKQILERGTTGNEYNIGAKNELSNLEYVTRICTLMDEYIPTPHSHTQLIKFVEDRPGHDWRYSVDCTKIFEELGWQPETNIDDGLRKTIEFYLSKQSNALQFKCHVTNN